jgi:hypothetical protein
MKMPLPKYLKLIIPFFILMVPPESRHFSPVNAAALAPALSAALIRDSCQAQGHICRHCRIQFSENGGVVF